MEKFKVGDIVEDSQGRVGVVHYVDATALPYLVSFTSGHFSGRWYPEAHLQFSKQHYLLKFKELYYGK